MNPKEKAEELVDKFLPHALGICEDPINYYNAIHCSLICVEEIIAHSTYYTAKSHKERTLKYWNEVKNELLKM